MNVAIYVPLAQSAQNINRIVTMTKQEDKECTSAHSTGAEFFIGLALLVVMFVLCVRLLR